LTRINIMCILWYKIWVD